MEQTASRCNVYAMLDAVKASMMMTLRDGHAGRV